MKKILLLAAVAGLAVSAQADTFGELFKITKCSSIENENGSEIVAGDVITNGQTIVWPYYAVNNAGTKWEACESEFPILATNISDEPWRLDYEIKRIAPSFEELPTSTSLGFVQGCYKFSTGEGNCYGEPEGNSVNTFNQTSEDGYPDVDPGEYLETEIKPSAYTDMTPRTFQLKFFVMEMGEVYKDATFTVNVKFTNEKDLANAVESVVAENGETVYYNLQGARVSNPEKGIFVKVQGNKATKVVL